MAGPFDLTGQNIENTYQRVLQTPDGVNIYDGTGSLFTVTAVAAPAGPNQSVQFNDVGTTSGSGTFTFNKTTNAVTLTGSLYTTDSIYFSGSGPAGRLVWNDTDGTLDLGLKGNNVTLQLGQEQVIRVVNKTGADLLESQYKAVRIRRFDEGGAQGQRLAIVLAQANNDANSVDTLGLVTEDIANNQEGFITTFGLVRNIDTRGTLQGETWNDGDVLYLSPTTPGAITNIKPQAPNHTIILGYVVYKQQNQGKIFVKVDNGYEIDELHNVRINTASLTAGQLLVRSGSNNDGLWINSNQLTGSYGLTGSLNATLGFTGSLFGTASWADSASQALTASFYQETDPIFVSKSASLATTGSNTFVGNQVVSGSFIIETSSSAAALRVTQTGTGDAILVEDSTNPDSTPFVVTAAGNVGIGLTTPQSSLHTRGNFSLGTGGSGNLQAFNWISTNNTFTFGNSAGDRGLQIGVNVTLDGGGGTAGAVISGRAATGGAGLVLNGSTLGTTNATLSSSKDLVITSTGNIGLGINTPQHKLDVSGSARVTSSLFLPGLTTTAQNNVVTVDITTGQLYYTASTAFGGGSSTPTFPYTGSAIISGSLTVTGSFFVSNSIDSDSRILYDSAATSSVDWTGRQLRTPGGNIAFTWETDYAAGSQIYQSRTIGINPQEALSSTPLQYAGQSISASIDPSTNLGEIVYLETNGIWYPVNQTTDTSTKMLGVYVVNHYVLLEGDVTLDNTNLIQSPGYGLPVYIREGDNIFSTNQPATGYIRTVGHCYYENSTTSGYWIIKFKPSNDWYKI